MLTANQERSTFSAGLRPQFQSADKSEHDHVQAPQPFCLAPNLFVGLSACARDASCLVDLETDAIVNANPEEPNVFENPRRQEAFDHLQNAFAYEAGRYLDKAAESYRKAHELDSDLKGASLNLYMNEGDTKVDPPVSPVHPSKRPCPLYFRPPLVTADLDFGDGPDFTEQVSEAFEKSFDFVDFALGTGRVTLIHAKCYETSATLALYYLIKSRAFVDVQVAISHVEAVLGQAINLHRNTIQFLQGTQKQISFTMEAKKEKPVCTTWGSCLEPSLGPFSSLKRTQCHPDFQECWFFDGLLTANESMDIIHAAENVGFGRTNFKPEYRGNLRLISIDFSLAELLWPRIQEHIPAELTDLDEEGNVWKPLGLNECFRVAKYHPGHKFGGHTDAQYVRNDTEQTAYTVNIYLNENFQQGCTRFFDNDRLDECKFAVVPKTGSCCIFRQPPKEKYFHEGQTVRGGVKYLLRTDIFYKKQL